MPPIEVQPYRLAVLISGGGRTLENIAAAIGRGDFNAKVTTVISSRPGVKGLERAARLGIPSHVVPRKQFNSPAEFSDVIWPIIREAGADLVCLCGFLSLITIPPDFAGKIVNVHPALLPSFGGKGMYGHHVHEAVIAAGCKVSGCTLHFADETYDTGPILVQRTCDVLDDDTPDTLAARVFEEECKAYPQAIKLLAEGRVILQGHRARVVPAIADMLERAKRFSEIAHTNQTRASGAPYALHPAAVVGLLREHGMSDPDVLTAGYLHDTVEDTGVSTDQLARAFNPRVASLVAELTIPPEFEKPSEKKSAWLVQHAPTLSPAAKWIKLADRAHNISELASKDAARQVRYAKATVPLLEALKPWPSEGLARRIIEGLKTIPTG
jgi:formyltetrahydrofolate-dependent phosphoribosylglycinamide formyltransferase